MHCTIPGEAHFKCYGFSGNQDSTFLSSFFFVHHIILVGRQYLGGSGSTGECLLRATFGFISSFIVNLLGQNFVLPRPVGSAEVQHPRMLHIVNSASCTPIPRVTTDDWLRLVNCAKSQRLYVPLVMNSSTYRSTGIQCYMLV